RSSAERENLYQIDQLREFYKIAVWISSPTRSNENPVQARKARGTRTRRTNREACPPCPSAELLTLLPVRTGRRAGGPCRQLRSRDVSATCGSYRPCANCRSSRTDDHNPKASTSNRTMR